MTSISAATSVKSAHLISSDQKPTDIMRTMLSKSSLAALPPAQLDQELALCVHDAVTAVVEPPITHVSDRVFWSDCTPEQLKRQAPGSILLMLDGTARYVPPGNSVRGPSDTKELEVRISLSGKDQGTWTTVASLAPTIDKVAWGCITSNGKAGLFTTGLLQAGQPVHTCDSRSSLPACPPRTHSMHAPSRILFHASPPCVRPLWPVHPPTSVRSIYHSIRRCH